MEVLRTPEERFADLPDFPHHPRYVSVDVDGTTLRLAHVEHGAADGHPVVLLHGEPTWGFLYRHVMPPLVAAGLRAIVPDMVGFGRSDKPADRDWYSYDHLADSLTTHLDALGLDEPVTLVVHDWGGPTGLRWAVDHVESVARLVVLDTLLYAPGGTPTESWLRFRRFVERSDTLPASMLVDRATTRALDAAEQAAYDAPFAEPAAHAGALQLPLEVPLDDEHRAAAEMWRVNRALNDFPRPTLYLWGGDDAILPVDAGRRMAERNPSTVAFEVLAGANHFLQEDAGRDIGQRIATFVDHGA